MHVYHTNTWHLYTPIPTHAIHVHPYPTYKVTTELCQVVYWCPFWRIYGPQCILTQAMDSTLLKRLQDFPKILPVELWSKFCRINKLPCKHPRDTIAEACTLTPAVDHYSVYFLPGGSIVWRAQGLLDQRLFLRVRRPPNYTEFSFIASFLKTISSTDLFYAHPTYL